MPDFFPVRTPNSASVSGTPCMYCLQYLHTHTHSPTLTHSMARWASFWQAASCMPVSVLSLQKKKTTRRAFTEGQVTRRTNPARSARPPEKFALENFTVSAAKFAEEFYSFRRRKTVSGVFYDYNEPMLLCLSQWFSCGSVHHGLLGLGEGAEGPTWEVCGS